MRFVYLVFLFVHQLSSSRNFIGFLILFYRYLDRHIFKVILDFLKDLKSQSNILISNIWFVVSIKSKLGKLIIKVKNGNYSLTDANNELLRRGSIMPTKELVFDINKVDESLELISLIGDLTISNSGLL